ncbi:MAG: acyl-CoA reductase [Polaromonas sp.]|nr:acyl-CoA reductase [Polaromonas sp.]
MTTTSANKNVFKAGYLPGLRDDEVQWKRLQLGTTTDTLSVDVPELSTDQIKTLASRIRQASRTHLKSLPISDIVRTIDTAIARLLNANDPYRQELERLLPRATGFDAAMVRLGLNSYLQTFRALQLQRFVTEDFANPKLLDEFQARPKGGWTKAIGPDLLVHVWAGNVPALPLWSFVSGLLVKAGAIGKMSSAEPIFASLFARLLVEVEPRWADCFAVVWWQGGDPDVERCVFAEADVVLAYGGNKALQAMQDRMPVTTRFLPHGHKLSFGMVSNAALSVLRGQATARAAALDIARWDQQGCYSPHVFYVQRGGPVQPLEFAQLLAGELAALAAKFTRRTLTLEEAASVGSWREHHEFESLRHAGHRVLGDATQAFTVVYADSPQPLLPGPLNRCILVVAVDSLHDVMPLIEPQRAYLQTVGLAAAPEELLALGEALGQAGVTRICALGAMTSPEAGWHHDGRFSLLDLVRMVDIDQSAELAAERFTSYEL